MPISHLLTDSFYWEQQQKKREQFHNEFNNQNVVKLEKENASYHPCQGSESYPCTTEDFPNEELMAEIDMIRGFKNVHLGNGPVTLTEQYFHGSSALAQEVPELVIYATRTGDGKVSNKIALGGYAYTKRSGTSKVAYWYCDQRRICSASLIERDGTFYIKEHADTTDKRRTKSGWGPDGNHATHPPDYERVQKEISTKLKWLERKQRAKERREAKALIRTRSTEREAKTEVVSADIPSSPAPSDIADEENFEDESTTLQRTDANQVLAERLKNPVLIDTDGGCYDAWALLLAKASALHHSDTIKFSIVGITTVHGATTVDHAVNNVSRILQTGETLPHVPIFKGMDSTLLDSNKNTPRPAFFGSDGFGDAKNLPPVHHQQVDQEHAVNAMIRLAETYKGRLTIIALGPLTNLAMAVKLKPEIKSFIKEIYVLGGNSEGIGNMTVSSEFNFFVDPEAAHIVLKNFNLCPVYILPWETCMRSAASTHTFRCHKIGQIGSQEVDLLNQIEKAILDKHRQQWLAPEAVLFACFLNHQMMRKTEQYHCTVELQGIHTRGMMVVDKNFIRQKPANCTLITEVDRLAFENMLIWAVTEHDHGDGSQQNHGPMETREVPIVGLEQHHF